LTVGPEARHPEDVGFGCVGFGLPEVAGGQENPVLVVAEVEGLRVWVAEREGVSDPVGQVLEVAGLVGRWREEV
jgi:hypothetical protein